MVMKLVIDLNFQLVKTANGVDTTPVAYETPAFWFGVFRYIAEGATIILVGLYWLNGIARRNNLSTFDIFLDMSLYH